MNSSYIRGGTQTVAEAMACFQHVIDEAYPNKGYMIAPKRIAIHGSTAIDGENNGGKGYYTIRAEQVVNGIPMIGALCSTLGDNGFRVAHGSTPETNRIANRLAPYSLGSDWRTDVYLKMYTSSNTDYSVYVSMNRIRTVEQEDVPLAPLDRVLASIEKEIATGHIRNIHALRLGYMRYSNPEMEDYAWAVPMWVLDCDYVPSGKQSIVDSFHEHFEQNRWEAYEFAQIPLDAQTGEMKIITTGDEATFAVPKMTTWEDIQ